MLFIFIINEIENFHQDIIISMQVIFNEIDANREYNTFIRLNTL